MLERLSLGVGLRAWKCMGVSLSDVVVGAHGHDDVVPDAARHRQHVPPVCSPRLGWVGWRELQRR